MLAQSIGWDSHTWENTMFAKVFTLLLPTWHMYTRLSPHTAPQWHCERSSPSSYPHGPCTLDCHPILPPVTLWDVFTLLLPTLPQWHCESSSPSSYPHGPCTLDCHCTLPPVTLWEVITLLLPTWPMYTRLSPSSYPHCPQWHSESSSPSSYPYCPQWHCESSSLSSYPHGPCTLDCECTLPPVTPWEFFTLLLPTLPPVTLWEFFTLLLPTWPMYTRLSLHTASSDTLVNLHLASVWSILTTCHKSAECDLRSPCQQHQTTIH